MRKKTDPKKNSREEVLKSIELLEKEKGFSKEKIREMLENTLKKICENRVGEGLADVEVNLETGEVNAYFRLTVVDVPEDMEIAKSEIRLQDAIFTNPEAKAGDIVRVPVDLSTFSRTEASNEKNLFHQKIKDGEKEGVVEFCKQNERQVLSGVVSRIHNNGISVDLGKIDGILPNDKMIPGEVIKPQQHIKVYVEAYDEGSKNMRQNNVRVKLSRTASGLVRRLFEAEIPEIHDGTVEIKSVSREAGSRVKIAVWSKDEKIDPVGSCIGLNSTRIDPIIAELNGEKIDVILWDEDPARFVENALAPAKVIAVAADDDEKTALVVVPDNQLSLAIGMKGQNAKLSAKLTGYKIDIKSETQAKEENLFGDYEEDYDDEVSEDGEENRDEEES